MNKNYLLKSNKNNACKKRIIYNSVFKQLMKVALMDMMKDK
jgi:hypothetical protein